MDASTGVMGSVDQPPSRLQPLRGAAARGALAGVIGVAAMTAAEKLEQRVDHRPNSYVPARTLLALIGRRPPADAHPTMWNHVMHWGTGMLVGSLRGVWSVVGIRGVLATGAHAVVRLAVDQTLENATGVGAPPAKWPLREVVIDVSHKLVYAAATGMVSDRFIRPVLQATHGEDQGRLRGGSSERA